MKAGETTLQGLLAAIGLCAVAMLYGIWDNQQQMRRALEHGHDAVATITGGGFRGRLPLTLDGWRPRVIDEGFSVDLRWRGRDGVERERKYVPVTHTYRRTILLGDKIRLVDVDTKLTDDANAVPVIVADAAGRFSSLQGWLRTWSIVASVAWVGFFAVVGWKFWRSRYSTGVENLGAGPSPRRLSIPPISTALAVFGLASGSWMVLDSWKGRAAYEQLIRDGVDTTAHIASAAAVAAPRGGRISYDVELAWKDRQGNERRFGPTNVSSDFWSRVTRDGLLTRRQTAIRYLENDPTARPIILEDARERQFQDNFGYAMGPIFMAFGAVCALWVLWRVRRR